MSPAKKKTTRRGKSSSTRKKTTRAASKRTARKSASKTSAGKKKASGGTKASTGKKGRKTREAAAPKRSARQAPALKSTAKARAKAAAKPPAEVSPTPPPPGVGRLGVKYVCFECGAKFYDLNRPEPLCPKCGADQRKRPKKDKRQASPPAERPGRAMAPLLQEEAEEEPIMLDDDGLEIGLGMIDEAEDEEEDEEP